MQRIKTVLKLMLLLLGIYLLLRILFQLHYYPSVSLSEELRVLYWGLRLDFTAIVYSNILFFIFYFLIAPFLPVEWDRRLGVWFFLVINLPFIALNVVDLIYYQFNLRRSTVDLFYVFTDSIHSFGALFRQYWYVVILFILVAVGFAWMVKRIIYGHREVVNEKRIWRWGLPVMFMAVCLLVARGWGRRPIVPSTALLHVEASKQPLVNNSTLNLLYSWLRFSTSLEKKKYFPPSVLDTMYIIRRQYPQEQGLDRRNIVIFLLESFNQSFFTPGRGRAKTPFFDSLMGRSTVCENAYANGHESSKGSMAVLGSIPSFPDEPLYISNYNAVQMKGIGSILKEEGYDTNFFLGAEYDHFNFAKLCRMIGIENYYSKDTYDQPGRDDGNWGIYDEYFFDYFAEVTARKKGPFFSVLYNISSHPPFSIPEKEKKQFTIAGQSAQQNSITYVDDCFRRLFEKIKTQAWFSNTLFVFCSDHTLLKDVYDKSYQYKAYHIPLFIFDPSSPQQTIINRTVQQLDVVPTVLDRIHYSKPFMSFGNSIFRPEGESRHFSICRIGEHYQLIDSATITGYDSHAEKSIYYYQYRSDSLLEHNLISAGDSSILEKEKFIKAVLQRFNNSMVEGDLLVR